MKADFEGGKSCKQIPSQNR